MKYILLMYQILTSDSGKFLDWEGKSEMFKHLGCLSKETP